MARLLQLLYTFRNEHARLFHGRLDRIHLMTLFVHECTELLVDFVHAYDVFLKTRTRNRLKFNGNLIEDLPQHYLQFADRTLLIFERLQIDLLL